MPPLVFVSPLTLAGGLYADLHGPNAITKPMEMMHATLNNNGEMSHQVTLMFDFETPLVPEGRISIDAAGGRFTGGAEADREAVAAFFETLRTQHQLFPADFNYVVISEKRALFNSMRESLVSFCTQYNELQQCVTDCRNGMVNLCGEISAWLGLRHNTVTLTERSAVSAFFANLKIQSELVGEDIRHAYQLVQLLNHRGRIPDGQVRLDATVLMPMQISWERSYYLLRTIYDEAVKKIPGFVSNIRVIDADDGLFKATVDVSSEPYLFCGSPDASRVAAKAKLLYAVIKYVNSELGHPIMDMHFEVRQYQDSSIARFDRRTAGLFRCAEKLKELMESSGTVFSQSSAEISAKLSANPCSTVIFEHIHRFSSRLAQIRGRFNEVYTSLSDSRVDRRKLESTLGNQA